ncbi:MAG: nucleotidyltransferase family protein [Planctomycetota bacterium]
MKYRFLPSPQQEQLVHTIVARDPQAAIAAWQSWKQSVDLDHIDTGSARLLPLAYLRLREHLEDDATLTLARGAYKKAWYRNLLLFRQGAQAIGKLRAAGISALVFKGAAIATRYYESPALRPMDDLDIAVPPDDALRALRVLQEDGWAVKDLPHQRGEAEDLVPYCHGFDLEKGTEQFLDLHWHLIALDRTPDADAAIWNDGDLVDFFGERVLMPNLTDSLLITCFHGCRQMFSGETSTLRWCADALELLRVGDVDWQRLTDAAETRGIGASVGTGLEYLRDTFGAEVPADPLARLHNSRPSFSRRHYLQCVMNHATPEQLKPRTALFLRYMEEVAATIPAGLSPGNVAAHLRNFVPWWRHMARRQGTTTPRLTVRTARRLVTSSIRRRLGGK